MKLITNLKYVVLVSLSLFFTSCSEDGADGDSYLKLDWAWTPEDFVTEDDQFPDFSSGMKGTYYQSTAGTWGFVYESWLYETYIGTYTVEFNPGEEAPDPFTDGEQGADMCYEMYLWLSGPAFVVSACDNAAQLMSVEDDSYIEELERIENLSLAEIRDKNSEINRVEYDLASISIDKSDADVVVKTGRLGDYTYELVYKKVK